MNPAPLNPHSRPLALSYYGSLKNYQNLQIIIKEHILKIKICRHRELYPGCLNESSPILPLDQVVLLQLQKNFVVNKRQLLIYVVNNGQFLLQIILSLNRNARNLANCEKKLRSTLKVEFSCFKKYLWREISFSEPEMA